LNKKPALEYLK